MGSSNKKRKTIEYGRYGYFFIAPFFIVYLLFQLYPLINTFYFSLLQTTTRYGIETSSFGGLKNFSNILGITEGEKAYFIQYLGNTVILWICNFIPQILVSLLMAAWLTNNKVVLKGTGAMKVIIYLPSVITAASVSVLFKNLFSNFGPMTQTLKSMGVIDAGYDFMKSVGGSRGLISFILFWMWYGNTSILLISGILGIDPGLFEAADIDGATGNKKFLYITLPLLKPILLYTLVTSAIGGLQMYDIPALFNVSTTGYFGNPDDKTTTMAMYIMRLYQQDPGRAGAVSVLLFIVTLIVSMILFVSMRSGDAETKKKKRRRRR